MATDRTKARGRARRRGVVLVLLAGVALVASACDWLQQGYNGGDTFAHPSEPAITASTVGTLHEGCSLAAPKASMQTPLVVGGNVVAVGEDGTRATITVYDANTGQVR